MNLIFINKMTVRLTASIAILAIIAGVMSPVASNVAEAAGPACTVVSNSSVQEAGSNSFESDSALLPGSWSTISGAEWIWGDADFLNAPAGSQTFTKKFIVNGTSTAAELSLLADNQYHILVNGSDVGGDENENNFSFVSTRNILSKLVMNAENTIEIEVVNLEGTGNNPAGLAFKIEMEGNTCDPITVDVCNNLDGVQTTVPEGRTLEGGECLPTVIITDNVTPKSCIGSENLIINGSFEDPVIATGYSVVSTIAGWVNEALSDFEIWNNQNGPAASGNQHLELDVVHPTTISQNVVTVPGNIYQVSMAFSPRSGRNLADNKVELVFDGNVIGTFSADGTALSQNSWSAAAFNATAASTSSKFELRDVGSDTGYGTLVDDVRVCLVEDNSTPVEEPEYTIEGYKFNDEDGDGEWDEDEDGIEGWEINLDQREVETRHTTTDADGKYSFTVATGSYQVTETQQKGWEQTATIGDGADGDICYITVSDRDPEARVITNYRCDFGNKETERRSGGGGGTRVGDRNPGTPTGEVLGASTSTPTGVVLGDATTTMPVGAPNTGAGGTSPVSVSLPTLVAILSTSTRKSK